MIQRKRQETKKKKFCRENRRCYRGRGERQRRRNFVGKTEGVTEEEARDKEEEILAGKQKV